MLHLDLAHAPATPHLPRRRLGAAAQVAASAVMHAVLLVIALLVKTAVVPEDVVQSIPMPTRRCDWYFWRPNCLLQVAAGVAEAISNRHQSGALREKAPTA